MHALNTVEFAFEVVQQGILYGRNMRRLYSMGGTLVTCLISILRVNIDLRSPPNLAFDLIAHLSNFPKYLIAFK